VQGVSPSGETTSTAAVPFGLPIINFGSVERLDNAVRFNWSVNPNGRPLQSPAYGVGVNGGNGTHTVTGVAPGGTATFAPSYTNEAGTVTVSPAWSGRANDPPPPPVVRAWVSKGDSATSTSCASNCNYIVVNVENFPAGNYRYACRRDGAAFWTSTSTKAFPANGAVATACYYGYPGTNVSVEIIGVIITPDYVW
ncbi:MAG: hypothetical protein GX868_11125, partial [Actinobacteria bacterium]|nr:hypothetical protein [Actinomycetota bacterium]